MDAPKIEEAKDQVFKKPVLFGPRPGKGKAPVKALQKSSDEDVEVDNDTKQPVAPQPVQQVVTNETDKPRSKSTVMAKIPYKEPSWGGMPPQEYFLEELKSGVIVRTIPLHTRSFHCFGRLDGCHVSMAHPTISRYHAVLQYRSTFSADDESRGFYLFDLGSTHGTFLNKNRLKPESFTRVQVGHMIKLGCSTRMFILQGPEEDQEEESELSITEMKEKRRLEKLEEEQRKEEEERKKAEEGINWGMDDDAEEETDLTENPYAVTTNEELYIDDPKKTLRGWFEREGEELNYECEEKGFGHFVCRVELPIDSSSGQPHVAEANVKGKKKEAVVQCALEACRILDRLGLLRQSSHESKQRKQKDWEADDYYDSDEDSFFDRTGELETKRQQRMKQMGKVEETIETYETLVEKHKNVVELLKEAEQKLTTMTSITQRSDTDDPDSGVDALDSYMSNLKEQNFDKLERKRTRVEIEKLKQQEAKLRSLVNFTKPPSLPEVKKPESLPPPVKTESKSETEPSKKAPREPEPSKSLREDFKSKRESSKNSEVVPAKIAKQTKANDVHQTVSKSEESEELCVKQQEPVKPKNIPIAKTKKASKSNTEEEYSTTVWQPPAGQTGDGRTSLNDKYGY
ncbi:unnamed protein product [Bemisia tabaci]|uniref:FHA domain-containing protein n=1 Tax=Bemisia tabaci TaxID=7038 RepID=A0A9P0CEW0_BEMTA|nr:unnamed protein product [Bemisia tabaci]